MTPIRRVFLGWDKPLLHTTVRQLLRDSIPGMDIESAERGKSARAGNPESLGSFGNIWNLSEWTLVVPVVRAAKHLQKLIAQQSDSLQLQLKKPKVLTVGRLPETLYRATLPVAGEMQQTLAWTRALLSKSDQALEPLMPVPPPREPVAPWVEMAGLLRRLCEDLAADGISPADVVEEVETEGERRRWLTINRLFDEYLKQLAIAKLADPFQQRRQAIESGICKAGGPIVLIGCIDIGSSTCRMLETIGSNVSVYIGAPENQHQLFDGCGRVSPGRWNDFHLEIEDENLISTGDASAQAAAVGELLQEWKPKFNEETVTIGITDDAFGPIVETELNLCGLPVHRIGSTVISRTAPGKLLQRVSEFLQARTWNNFAALIRHTDVLSFFASTNGTAAVLTQLDHLRSEHFPVFVSDSLPASAANGKTFAELLQVVSDVLKWLAPLDRPAAILATWCEPLKLLLQEIYLNVEDDDFGNFNKVVVNEIIELLDHFQDLPSALDVTVSGHAAIDMILQRLSEPMSLTDPDQPTVQISGWLDLTLDDADILVVVGLNHPFVPQAVTSDAFLPGALRARLSVADNERRFARDLYVLQMINSTRRKRAFIVGRSGPDGSPTPPSRLLAACPSSVTLRRVRRLLEHPPRDPQPRTRWDRDALRSDLPIPQASAGSVISEVSVTAFRAYLECPFRFYLRHVLNLRPLDDSAAELAANQFGDLVHAAVERFGDCEDKNLTDPKDIEASLLHHLHAYASVMYGESAMAAVRLQVTQAEKRLKVFADKQAARIAEGWIIKKAEAAVRGKDGAVIECDDGRKLKLKGRIDRIDFHPESGRWAILDYKTHGHAPLEKHYDKKKKSWIDLQLPLYLLMLKALKIDAPYDKVQVGYFNIPDNPAECDIHLLDLTPEMRAEAFAEAKRVAAQILAGNFKPQMDASLIPYDDYSMILQTGAAENLLMASEGMED